jgi:cyanophycinase
MATAHVESAPTERDTVWEPSSTHGPILAIGGAEDKFRDRIILSRFIALAGGHGARIVVVPTASSIEFAGERYKAIFLSLGISSVEVAYISDRTDAGSEDVAALLELATGIFLTGGNQMRLASIIGGTRAMSIIRQRNKDGAVVAGTSAGASILSSHMVAFGSSGASPKQRMAQMIAGFGLVPEAIIDQHFRQRDRIGRLMMMVATNPGLLGVGIDEDTAALFTSDGILEVLGRHSVTVVDGGDAYSNVHQVKGHGDITVSGAIIHMLTNGNRFDMRRRQLILSPNGHEPI